MVDATGCTEAPVAESGVVSRAEIAGEVESWGFGRTGSAEAIRGVGTGAVPSARTNVGWCSHRRKGYVLVAARGRSWTSLSGYMDTIGGRAST